MPISGGNFPLPNPPLAVEIVSAVFHPNHSKEINPWKEHT